MDILISLLVLIIAIIISIPIHELGHLVCGLMTGYTFLSYRIGPFLWIVKDSKLSFTYSSTKVGLGQCLMAPPSDEDNFKFLAYNLGGGLANIITAVIILGISAVTGEISFWLPIAAASLALGLINLIPASGNIPNDGYNIKSARKSEEAKHGFYMMLHANSEMASGKRLRDFSDTDFKVSDNCDQTNIFIINLIIWEAARLYDLGKYEESINVYRNVNVDPMPMYYRNNIYADHLYYYTVHNPDYELAKHYRNMNKMSNFLNLGIPTCTRIRAAYEYFVNNNKIQGKTLLETAKKQIPSMGNSGLEKMESDYVNYLYKLFI